MGEEGEGEREGEVPDLSFGSGSVANSNLSYLATHQTQGSHDLM